MKKILITYFILLLSIFIYINKDSIFDFYLNYSWEYSRSNSLEWKYNAATLEYIKWKYNISLNNLLKIEDWEKAELNFRKYHNLWNSIYEISKEKNDLKEWLLEKSIENYEKALLIKFDEYTQKNLEFVKAELEKLKEEKKKNEEKNSEDSESEGNENEKDSEWKEEWENNKEEWSKDSKDELDNKEGEKKWEEKTSENNTWEEKSSWKELSEESKKIIDEKIKQLQEEQWDISKLYNKKYQENNNPFDKYDAFFENSIFDNSALDKEEKKDW